MADLIAVTVYTELTSLGEVQFTVKSNIGIYTRKCLHDALSDAGVKMTGIEPILEKHNKILKNQEIFAIDETHIR